MIVFLGNDTIIPQIMYIEIILAFSQDFAQRRREAGSCMGLQYVDDLKAISAPKATPVSYPAIVNVFPQSQSIHFAMFQMGLCYREMSF